ncbi:MAG: hypothetical protein LBU13_01500 [Synergistaceae bacterium]|jgi:hypothetical protein|nr:hypothetical protein [Synergistaceae bacterium]
MSVSGSSIKARRFLIRLLTVACLVGVGFLTYHLGKEFEVIIDNAPVSVSGVRYEAMPYGRIFIDGDTKGFDMWAGDRVIKKMAGKNHKLTVKVLNEDDSVLKTIEREITLDFNPKAEMLSVSAIIAESSGILTPNPFYSEPVFVPDASPVPSPKEDAPDDIFGGM